MITLHISHCRRFWAFTFQFSLYTWNSVIFSSSSFLISYLPCEVVIKNERKNAQTTTMFKINDKKKKKKKIYYILVNDKFVRPSTAWSWLRSFQWAPRKLRCCLYLFDLSAFTSFVTCKCTVDNKHISLTVSTPIQSETHQMHNEMLVILTQGGDHVAFDCIVIYLLFSQMK